MTGQEQLKGVIDKWIQNNSIPRFLIISGPRLSGRYTLVKYLHKQAQSYLVECELGVESVRESVRNCYKCNGRTLYLFKNADRMSLAAKNALLKITEEPPRQAHFILTVESPDNTLETLRSRAVNLSMAPYNKAELDEFSAKLNLKSPSVRIFSTSPGEMLMYNNLNVQDIVDFCNTVIDNIKKVSGVNAFKILNRLKIKEGQEGFDVDIFFRILKQCLFIRIFDEETSNENCIVYSNMLRVTSQYEHEFKLSGIKRDSTLDMWVLEMREA